MEVMEAKVAAPTAQVKMRVDGVFSDALREEGDPTPQTAHRYRVPGWPVRVRVPRQAGLYQALCSTVRVPITVCYTCYTHYRVLYTLMLGATQSIKPQAVLYYVRSVL